MTFKDVQEFERLETVIHDFFAPKLLILLKQGKINDGKYNPQRKDSEIISTVEAYTSPEGKISVTCQIYWGGDIYDSTGISLTEQEWNAIN